MQYLKQKQKKQTEKRLSALNATVASAHRKSKTENGGDCKPIAAVAILSVNFWVARYPH